MAVNWNSAEIIARVRAAAMRGVVIATDGVRAEATRLILDTPKTGRLYYREGISRVSRSGRSFSGGHRASAPGEAPASDTGVLVRGITTSFDPPELTGRVNSEAAYAAHLEYGTQRMEPRPYMRPALSNRREEISRVIQEEIRREIPLDLGGG